MRKVRPRRPDDQQNIQRAIDLIYETMNLNSIEPSLWAGALLSILVDGYINSGFTYPQFREEMEKALDFYEKQHME